MLGSRALPSDIWNQVETYVMSQGGMASGTQALTHPHLAPATDSAQTQKLNDPRSS